MAYAPTSAKHCEIVSVISAGTEVRELVLDLSDKTQYKKEDKSAHRRNNESA